MIEKYTSIQEVISKVYRDLNITEERRWEDMVEWAAEALEQIGSFSQNVHKTVELEVYNNRAHVPCDMVQIIQLAKNGTSLKYLSGSFDSYYHTADSTNLSSRASKSSRVIFFLLRYLCHSPCPPVLTAGHF